MFIKLLPDRLTSKHLPFIGVFLVSDFLRTDRYADEPYRSEENRIAQSARDIRFIIVAGLDVYKRQHLGRW